MTILSELTPFSYHVLLLVGVMIFKYIVDIVVANDPLRYYQFYCSQLNNKVNNPNSSASHQTIAGLLALLITLVPITIILWLFADFVAVTYIWHGLLLYFALGRLNLGKINKSIAQDILTKQTDTAKLTLEPFMLRNTENLSPVGLSKAAIEMQLLRNMQQVYTVVLLFLLLGPLVAIAYRLMLEMHYCCNTKLPHNKHFGIYSQIFSQVFNWLPSRVMATLILLTTIGHGSLLFWRLSKQHFFKLNSDFLISIHAFSLGVRLGGVAMYQHEKLRKVAFNDLGKQPDAGDIVNGTSKVNFTIMSTLFLTIALALGIEFLTASY